MRNAAKLEKSAMGRPPGVACPDLKEFRTGVTGLTQAKFSEAIAVDEARYKTWESRGRHGLSLGEFEDKIRTAFGDRYPREVHEFLGRMKERPPDRDLPPEKIKAPEHPPEGIDTEALTSEDSRDETEAPPATDQSGVASPVPNFLNPNEERFKSPNALAWEQAMLSKCWYGNSESPEDLELLRLLRDINDEISYARSRGMASLEALQRSKTTVVRSCTGSAYDPV